MTGRRAVVGLCMLCALAFSAFAAQSAAASGTTAFTCKKTGAGGGFKKEHCKPSDAGSGEYSHQTIAENTTTEIIGNNAKTNPETTGAVASKLKETIGGVELELQATTVEGTGTLVNKKEGTEHYAEVPSGTLKYTGVTVVKPAGKGCEVTKDTGGVEGEKGKIDTNKLKGTTKGQGDAVKIEPETGTVFATFFITCVTKVPALEGTWEVTGSLKCPTDGATINCTHTEVTTQNTLKGKGNKAGLEGSLTLSGRVTGSGSAYTPISATTEPFMP